MVITSLGIALGLCSCVWGQSEPSGATTTAELGAVDRGFDPSQQREVASGAPDSVDVNLRDAKERPAGVFPYGPVSLIDPYWSDFNDFLDNHRIKLGLSYTIVFQNPSGANQSAPAAVGGDLDIFGNWRLLGKPDGDFNGYLYYHFEQRSSIGTAIAPKAIAGDIGSLWGTTNGFNEEPFLVKELYWQQQFFGEKAILRLGRLDPTNYYDSNVWQSDSKYFMNQAFSSFPVRVFPSPGVGFNLKLHLADWLSVSTGVQNAQGDATMDDGDFWDFLAVWTATEVAVTPDIPGLGRGNYRVTYWYRADVGSTPQDDGVDLSFDQECGKHFVPFFRYGYNEGNAGSISNMISGGVGYRGMFLSRSDILGAAFSWGEPTKPGVRSQYATEIFYRLQVSPDNQFTIGYQWIIDPSNDPTEGTVGVFELRWRLAL
jgi:hypothetical protein